MPGARPGERREGSSAISAPSREGFPWTGRQGRDRALDASKGLRLGTRRLGDYSTDRRVLVLSAAAVVIGAIGALAARGLDLLIALITNLAYGG